jgi:hypothetical protein
MVLIMKSILLFNILLYFNIIALYLHDNITDDIMQNK